MRAVLPLPLIAALPLACLADATWTFEDWGRDAKWNTSLFHLTMASLAGFLCE